MKMFTFPPAWGLPTTGPFGLKLAACLRLLDIPCEASYEVDVGKGPKRKSPWIEDGAVTLGDTELILDHVRRTTGKELDGTLSPADRARSHVLQRMLEEHYHQVFEYELVVNDDGFAHFKAYLEGLLPAELHAVVVPHVREGLRAHLFERGIGRHTAEEIVRMGRADIDALATWLGDRPWFITDAPTKVDASAFGLLAVSIKSPLPTPTCAYARTKPNLVAFVERGLARWFTEAAA